MSITHIINIMKNISITIEKEDLSYLKKRGISRSGFIRQAIKAHKEKKFDYDMENQ